MQGNLNDLLKELPPDLARTVARYGVRLAIDLLETLYADLAGEAAPASEPAKPARKKLGRPRKTPVEAPAEKLPKVRLVAKRTVAATKSGWSDDPEERRREMARRVEVRAAKVSAERRSGAARRRWDNMSATQRQDLLRKLQRGRKRSRNAKTDVEAVAA